MKSRHHAHWKFILKIHRFDAKLTRKIPETPLFACTLSSECQMKSILRASLSFVRFVNLYLTNRSAVVAVSQHLILNRQYGKSCGFIWNWCQCI